MKIKLYTVAIFLSASGAACFIFAPHYSFLKPFGMALVTLGAYFFSVTGRQKPSIDENGANSTPINSAISKKLDIVAQCLGLVAIFAVVVSYFLLRSDALDGGHQVWPAYAFAASVLFGATVWSYLIAKSISRRKGGGGS